jgi:hypothetical protein
LSRVRVQQGVVPVLRADDPSPYVTGDHERRAEVFGRLLEQHGARRQAGRRESQAGHLGRHRAGQLVDRTPGNPHDQGIRAGHPHQPGGVALAGADQADLGFARR